MNRRPQFGEPARGVVDTNVGQVYQKARPNRGRLEAFELLLQAATPQA